MKSNLPEAFKERIIGQLPSDESERFFASLQTTSPVTIRYNPIKCNNKQHLLEIPWCKEGRILPVRPVFTLDPHFHAGNYYVQEAGSMLLEPLLSDYIEQLKNGLILDLCAAPGGKSTHLLSLLGKDCTLVCNEIIPQRNKVLRHNLAKWGYPNTIVTQSNPSQIAASGLKFDLIVVDAPCSGEGLFRKDPKAMMEWSPSQAQQCAIRQNSILDEILPALKTGGLLLYSTCTYNPEENDLQIQRLMETGKFKLVTPNPPETIKKTTYGWQAFPHLTTAEGFYCCLLEYTGEEQLFKKTEKLPKQRSVPFFNGSDWLENAEKYIIYPEGEYLNAATLEVKSAVVQLSTSCYLRSYGIILGEMKGKNFVPSPELALCIELKTSAPGIELSHDEAIKYLRCEAITAGSTENGWHLIKFESSPLGWAKHIGNRWNNYFPKDWRILMNNTTNKGTDDVDNDGGL